MDYNYPLRSDWSTEEIITVTEFYTTIEQAYEGGTDRRKILEAYKAFKKIVPSKAEEKTLFREFEQASGYKSYPIIREAGSGDGQGLIKG